MSYSVFPEAFLITMFGFIYVLMFAKSGKGKRAGSFKAFCIVLLVLYSALLIWMALVARIGNDCRDLLLTPLYTIKTVLHSYNTFDVFKLIVDNVLVFIPLGMLLPAAAGKTPSAKSFVAVSLCGLAVSVLIEALQYAFSLGYSEVDDVIYNTFGTMIGAGIFVLGGNADLKGGNLNLKKGWLKCLFPAILFSCCMFAAWIYREYILFKK